MKNINFTKISDCFNITIIEGVNTDHDFVNHFHNSFNIGLIKDGEALFKIKDKENRLKKSDFYLINPKEIHSLKTIGDKSVSYTVLNIEAKDLFLIFKNKNTLFKNNYVSDLNKYNLFIENIPLLLSNDLCKIEKQEILINILNNFNYEFINRNNLNTEKIEAVNEYININYHSKIDLKDLAELSCMSAFHFIREFKKIYGLTPFDLIIQLRIKKAQKLLLDSNNISAISLDLGFYDQSHFTKYFKKHVGISPKKFKTNYKISR